MVATEVLIEAQNPYAAAARELLAAADFKPVRRVRDPQGNFKIFHQIARTAYDLPVSGALDIVVQRIHAAVKKAQTRHHNRSIVFCLPEMPAREFVRVMAQMTAEQEEGEPLDLANTLPDAVARLLQRNQERTAARPQFALDALVGVDAHGTDLRDDETGRLNAAKVLELFGLKMTDLAKAAGISKQGLDQNPSSERAQSLLRLFERVARLRSHPQFRDPADLRKWFRRPLALFGNHSAEDLFSAGKLEIVAEKVDQLLIGDFGG